MEEVQGGDNVAGVILAKGSSVVLSACNTGRGEIKAEGVVGLARGFILAGASCVVVSLWSVSILTSIILPHALAPGRIVTEHLAVKAVCRHLPK